MTAQSPSWYIRGEGNQPVGPYRAEQVIQGWRAGRVDANTICWREGMPDWLPLARVEPFASAMCVTQPQSPPRPLIGVWIAAGIGIVVVLVCAVSALILYQGNPRIDGSSRYATGRDAAEKDAVGTPSPQGRPTRTRGGGERKLKPVPRAAGSKEATAPSVDIEIPKL